MPVILTSNGLTSRAVTDAFTQLYTFGYAKAAIIVTADPEYREKNWRAVSTKEEFEKIGFQSTFFDIEFASPHALTEFDVIHFNSGNPFYLIHQIRRTHTERVLHQLLAGGKVISGASGGSIVLGQTIVLINEFDPQMNAAVGLSDWRGVGLTPINVCPHYSKYLTRYDHFEERIRRVEKTHHIQVTRINDGDAILSDGPKTIEIQAQ